MGHENDPCRRSPSAQSSGRHQQLALALISQTRSGRGGELGRHSGDSVVRSIGLGNYLTRFASRASVNFRPPVMRVHQGARQHGGEQAWCFRCVPVDSGGAEGTLKVDVGEFELVLVRASRGDGEVDAAHTGSHLRPELQQLEANGRDGGIGELAVAQTDTA